MKKLSYALVLLFFTSGALFTIDGQNRYSNTELGIILGEPTGISLKAWQSNRTAFDGAIAWSFSGSGNVHLHANYLRHSWMDVDNGDLAIYYGLGARLIARDNPKFGARIPVGLQYLIPNSRLAAFFEVVPILDLAPSTEFDVNGGIGLRIFL
ncbi:MAG: hypothetical protein ACNA78_04890 [Balneolaceae bacterium]